MTSRRVLRSNDRHEEAERMAPRGKSGEGFRLTPLAMGDSAPDPCRREGEYGMGGSVRVIEHFGNGHSPRSEVEALDEEFVEGTWVQLDTSGTPSHADDRVSRDETVVGRRKRDIGSEPQAPKALGDAFRCHGNAEADVVADE